MDQHALNKMSREQLVEEFAALQVRVRELEGSAVPAGGGGLLKKGESIRLAERNMSEAIIASIGDGISICDTEFRILYQNQVHRQMVGEHIGELCYQAYHDRDSVCPGCPVEQTFVDGAVHCRQRVIKRTGRIVYLENTASPVRDDSGRIIAGIEVIRDIGSRVEKDRKLKAVMERLQAIYDASPDMIFIYDRQGRIIDVNENVIQTFRVNRDGIATMRPFAASCNGCTHERFQQKIDSARTGRNLDFEWAARRPSGEEFPVEVRLRKLVLHEDAQTEDNGVVAVVRDITPRKKAEEQHHLLQMQLQQSQKMDSIGRLAGGIAHDFNNILSAIIGYSELSLMGLSSDHRLHEPLSIIKRSGERAEGLTRQLLAFSRKQILAMQVTDIASLVKDMTKMFRRIIPEDIVLELDIDAPVQKVMADPGQLEQVLMNLMVNARDAMPDGGRLRVETSEVVFIDEYVQDFERVAPGSYVQLAVTDTGSGMTAEEMRNIFEPFYTTKEKGKGTGLGLATVYGIVSQHKGAVLVESNPGNGTVFRVLLPVFAGTAEAVQQQRDIVLPPGSETVLVVDDEPSIRQLVADILKPLGYQVHMAAGGEEALALADSLKDRVDILLTDEIMPGMKGQELAGRWLEDYPRTLVVFMSGYMERDGERQVLAPGDRFIQKPLTPQKLALALLQLRQGK